MKSIVDQVRAMARRWPKFDLAEQTEDRAIWFGPVSYTHLTLPTSDLV